MFKTIRWRFVAIYFTLVLVALIIIGVFMVSRLEASQLDDMEEEIRSTVTAMLASGDEFSDPNWQDNIAGLQSTLEQWQISPNYQIYTIYDPDAPKLVATVNVNTPIQGENAYAFGNFEPEMIVDGFKGEYSRQLVRNSKEETSQMHLTYPILDTDGDTNGIFYIISDLSTINELIGDFGRIFLSTLGISFIVTVVLGLFLAGSITEPIVEITEKVETLAAGDYDQKIEVKSKDEIGQLAATFNFLTNELNKTITDMEIERGKLDTIFEYMQEGVIALDRKDMLIHYNKAASDILQLAITDKDDKVNLNKLNIYGIDYDDEASLEGESFLEFNDRYYNVLYGPYLDDRSYPSGLIMVFQDVTKEHKLDETRKDFVANVSHELKTPLTTIKTYTETILENQDLDQSTKYRFLQVVSREVDRMNSLVQDLLQLSSIDYENVVMNVERIKLSEFMENMIASLKPLRNERNIDLQLRNFSKDLVINSERSSLEKIILNILSNAYKYTDPGGRVEIEIMDFKNSFRISIKDNGIGIPYADQKHIFNRFYRVEKGRSRLAGGTGLGLSIAKELVDLLDGTLVLSSEPGLGTEVIITMPKDIEVDNNGEI